MPTREEVIRLAADRGVLTALVIDANVCLDLANLAQGTLALAAQERVKQFVQDIAYSGADVLPGFGLSELSLNRTNWSIDTSKLQSLEANLSLAIDSGLGRKEQRPADLEDASAELIDSDMFKPFIPLFKVFYACLLKVALLSIEGLSRDRAMPNLEAFMTWMSDDLDCVSALSLQAAVAIFGGDSLARKLIGAGRTGQSLRAVWGGAWDILYVHQLYQSTQRTLGGLPLYSVFVTRDRAFYRVFSQARLERTIRLSANRSPFLVGVASSYPHYATKQHEVARLFERMALSRIERFVESHVGDESRLDTCIGTLESQFPGAIS
jgi:hypothetical protein